MLDAIKLLRIPFSIFLMPVFWFSLSNLDLVNVLKGLHIFLILHLFVYPASNGYNSYFDKDEGSIGGLKTPPKVNKKLFPLVVLFDLISVLYAFYISPYFALLIFIYLLVSKAYSFDKIRLKKYPITSTFVVCFFQGFFTFFMVQIGMGLKLNAFLKLEHLLPAICSSIFLLGSYPLTQIYQHQEDKARGDITLSLLLGISKTFRFSRIFFMLGTLLLLFNYYLHASLSHILIFLGCGIPTLVYFEKWYIDCKKKPKAANYEKAMRMNIISSLCLSAAFILMIFY